MTKRCNCWNSPLMQAYCPIHGDPKQLERYNKNLKEKEAKKQLRVQAEQSFPKPLK
jgi:hypothetical protein